METWAGVQGVVPLVRYDDGAWFGRLTSVEGFDTLVRSAWRRQPRHWTTFPYGEDAGRSNVDDPMFVYVDPQGETQAVVMLSMPTTRAITSLSQLSAANYSWAWPIGVNDLGGPGLGRITDPKARARVLGIIYELMFPDTDNPFIFDLVLPQRVPWVLEDAKFRRKKTGTASQYARVRKQTGATVMDRLNAIVDRLKAAKGLVKAKGLGFQTGFSSGAAMSHPAHPLSVKVPERVLWWSSRIGGRSGFQKRVALEYNAWEDTWRVLVFDESRQDMDTRIREEMREGEMRRYFRKRGIESVPRISGVRELETLGTSGEGPFEAMVAAGLVVAASDLPAWVQANTVLDGTWRYDAEGYALLEAPDPMLLPLEDFIAFSAALSEAW